MFLQIVNLLIIATQVCSLPAAPQFHVKSITHTQSTYQTTLDLYASVKSSPKLMKQVQDIFAIAFNVTHEPNSNDCTFQCKAVNCDQAAIELFSQLALQAINETLHASLSKHPNRKLGAVFAGAATVFFAPEIALPLFAAFCFVGVAAWAFSKSDKAHEVTYGFLNPGDLKGVEEIAGPIKVTKGGSEGKDETAQALRSYIVQFPRVPGKLIHKGYVMLYNQVIKNEPCNILDNQVKLDYFVDASALPGNEKRQTEAVFSAISVRLSMECVKVLITSGFVNIEDVTDFKSEELGEDQWPVSSVTDATNFADIDDPRDYRNQASVYGKGATVYVIDKFVNPEDDFVKNRRGLIQSIRTQEENAKLAAIDNKGKKTTYGHHGAKVMSCVNSLQYGTAREASIRYCSPEDSFDDYLYCINLVANHVLTSGPNGEANNAAVFTLSLVYNAKPDKLTALYNAFETLSVSGFKALIVAAGNSNGPVQRLPQTMPQFLSIGAHTQKMEVYKWLPPRSLKKPIRKTIGSNFGTLVNLYAPGNNIAVNTRFGIKDIINGTSVAAPFVAGVVASFIGQILTYDADSLPTYSSNYIHSRLMATATRNVTEATGRIVPVLEFMKFNASLDPVLNFQFRQTYLSNVMDLYNLCDTTIFDYHKLIVPQSKIKTCGQPLPPAINRKLDIPEAPTGHKNYYWNCDPGWYVVNLYAGNDITQPASHQYYGMTCSNGLFPFEYKSKEYPGYDTQNFTSVPKYQVEYSNGIGLLKVSKLKVKDGQIFQFEDVTYEPEKATHNGNGKWMTGMTYVKNVKSNITTDIYFQFNHLPVIKTSK